MSISLASGMIAIVVSHRPMRISLGVQLVCSCDSDEYRLLYNSVYCYTCRVLLASRRSTRSAFCGPVISGPGQHQDQIDSDLGGSHTVGQVPQAQALSRAGVQDTFSPPISRQCQGRRARSVSQKDPAGRYSFDPKRKPCILWIS